MNRYAGVLGAVALCGSVICAAGAQAATVELTLDLRPGFCPNLVNQQRMETIEAHVLGKALDGVDGKSIVLYRPDGVGAAITPASIAIEPNITVAGGAAPAACDCTASTAGDTRLALQFKGAAVFETLQIDEASLKQGVKITVTGVYADGTSFTASDCIGFLGAGDVNADGATDVLDFAILASHFGEAVAPGDNGDLDGDGDVDIFDFSELASAF